MVHHPPLLHILGVARKLSAPDGHVISAVQLRRHPQALQRPDHRAAEGGEVKVAARVVGDEGEVHVPQVVIDRPAPDSRRTT